MGIVETVLAAMESCMHDPIVQTYGLGVLRNLSFLRENRRRVALSGMPACLKIACGPLL
jgi:hypothetical protein